MLIVLLVCIIGNIINRFAPNLDDIMSWFDQFQIESIEVSISGGIETGGVLKLAVSAKGEGGLRLKLKPKTGTVPV